MPFRRTRTINRRPRRGRRSKVSWKPRSGSGASRNTWMIRGDGRWVRPRQAWSYARLPPSAYQAEKKLLEVTPRNERGTLAIQTGARAAYRGFVIGAKPAQWTGTYDDMGGILISKGDDSDQRNGQYVFLKHSNITFNIDTNASALTTPPMEVRVIVFRARRSANPAGVAYNPSQTLFLDETGNACGHETSGVDGFDLTRRMLNRRDWIVKRDHKFILSKPLTVDGDGGGAIGYTGKYPVCKNFRFKLPYNKKTRYGTANLPEDCAYHWGIIVYTRSIAKDTATAGECEVNLRGNTVYLDP